jgi:hypothetical protein
LQKTPTLATSPSQPLVIFDLSRKRPSSATNDHFSFFAGNSVLANVFDVPLIPAEFHELLMQENDLGVKRSFSSYQAPLDRPLAKPYLPHRFPAI